MQNVAMAIFCSTLLHFVFLAQTSYQSHGPWPHVPGCLWVEEETTVQEEENDDTTCLLARKSSKAEKITMICP